MENSKSTRVLILALSACVAACSTAGDTLEVLAGGGQRDPRHEALRRRLDLRVEYGTTGISACGLAALPDGGVISSADAGPASVRASAICTPEQFRDAVNAGCVSAEEHRRAGTCANRARTAARSVCVAETLLRVAGALDSEAVVVDAAGGYVIVPPQDAESNSQLAQFAMHAAMAVIDSSAGVASCGDADLAASADDGSADAPDELAATTVGDEVAGFFREGYHLVIAARDVAVRSATASSDGLRSWQTDLASAEYDELAAWASRASVAHMLLGGANGMTSLRSVEETGFFPRPRLSRDGRRAVAYLRTAAISPTLLADERVTMDDLIQGTSSPVVIGPADALRYRLAFYLPRQELFGASAEEFYRLLAVPAAAFAEARAYLVAERWAFDRSPTYQLPPERLPDGQMSNSAIVPGTSITINMPLYAATRNEPVQPLTAWWSAALRYDPEPAEYAGSIGPGPAWDWVVGANLSVMQGGTWGTRTTTGYEIFGRVGGNRTVIAAIESTRVRASATVQVMDTRAAAATGTTQAMYRRMRDTFAGVLSDVGFANADDASAHGPIGRARACWVYEPADARIEIDLEVPSLASEELFVAESREALDCAVTGAIEGARCTPGDLVLRPSSDWSTRLTSGMVTLRYAKIPTTRAQALARTRPNNGITSLFVLRRRDGFTGSQPGGFAVVAGFMLPPMIYDRTTAAKDFCTQYAIVPSVEAQARDIIAPSTIYGADPAVSCAGVPADARIPLENELTDDGNGVENSWRHYLTLAEQAAQEADMLGETLIEQGLQMDLRAELATDELRRICGVDLSISPFARVESTRPPITGTDCDPGYVFQRPSESMDGVCVIDPVAYIIANAGVLGPGDRAQLAECLGAMGENADWVALGDTPLCMWRTSSSDSSICADLDDDHPCPFFANGDDDAGWSCGSTGDPEVYPSEATPYPVSGPVERRLSLFGRPDPGRLGGSDDGDRRQEYPCEQLARLRAGSISFEQFGQLFSSPFMKSVRFRRDAENLRWVASVGDHSDVLFGDSVIFSTGRPDQASEDWHRWPLGPSPRADLCPSGAPAFAGDYRTYTGPLFCLSDRGTVGSDEPYHWSARIERARLNDMLARAVIAARVLGGASLAGLEVPFYPRTEAYRFFVYGAGWNDIAVVGGPLASESDTLTYWIDHRLGDHPDDGSAHTWGGRGMKIDGAAGVSTGGCSSGPDNGVSSAEWIRFPYDAAAVEQVYNDAEDCDDDVQGMYDERQLPLLVRALPGKIDSADALRNAAILWGEEESFEGDPITESYVFGRLLFDRALEVPVSTEASFSVTDEIDLDDMSEYFHRWTKPHALYDWAHTYADQVSGEGSSFDWRGSAIGNSAFIARSGLSQRDYLNGMELLCSAARESTPAPVNGCEDPLVISRVADLETAVGHLNCVADRFRDRSARTVIRGLPEAVVEGVTLVGPATLGQLRGEYGTQVGIIRGALIDLREAQSTVADQIRFFANALGRVRSVILNTEYQSRIDDWQLAGDIATQINSCVVGRTEAAASSLETIALRARSAEAMCSNGVFQRVVAERIGEIRDEALALQVRDALIEADDAFVASAAAIRDRETTVRGALSEIDGAIAAIHGLQAQGRVALSRALFLDSDSTGAHFEADTAMRRRYNTTRARYEAAHRRAIQTAYIARVALEQRLGVNLDQLVDDLYTVEAPSGWVDELCGLPAVDYERIRDSGHSDLDAPDGYAGYYVGDYVRRLEQVFESYSFAYPFEHGTDTAVISLRDDVLRLRQSCPTEVPNLLLQAGQLDARPYESGVGWAPSEDCTPASGITTDTCIHVRPISSETEPVGYREPSGLHDLESGSARAYRVTFGSLATATTSLSQTVALATGRYRLSWWAKPTPGAMSSDQIEPSDAVRAMSGSTTLPLLNAGGGPTPFTDPSGWGRYDYFFDVPADGTVDVAIVPGGGLVTGRTVDIAGIQLERAGAMFAGDVNRPLGGTGVSVAEGLRPGRFYNTRDTRIRDLPVCADTDGTEYRRRAWTYDCVRVCPDGYGGSCPESAAGTRCYYETRLSIGSDGLQRLLTGTSAGFASGNFNYRFERVGVNIVGSGLRDCSRESTGSCYGGGNVSVTLLHQGPFLVRNTFGELYYAPLFPGRIESARALAAERAITNPMSGTDRVLLQDYMRAEFQGRPLAGSLVIRVWDEPGLAFDRLEDVQLIVDYRYWQHQR